MGGTALIHCASCWKSNVMTPAVELYNTVHSGVPFYFVISKINWGFVYGHNFPPQNITVSFQRFPFSYVMAYLTFHALCPSNYRKSWWYVLDIIVCGGRLGKIPFLFQHDGAAVHKASATKNVFPSLVWKTLLANPDLTLIQHLQDELEQQGLKEPGLITQPH